MPFDPTYDLCDLLVQENIVTFTTEFIPLPEHVQTRTLPRALAHAQGVNLSLTTRQERTRETYPAAQS